jgi:hypothetical protein
MIIDMTARASLTRLICGLFLACLEMTQQATAAPVMDIKTIDALVDQYFGPDTVAFKDETPEMPRYLWGNFNGDGMPDLVIPLDVEKARASIGKFALTVIPLHGGKTIAEEIGQHCLALGILQGRDHSYQPFVAARVFFLYECFSGYAKVAPHAALARAAGLNLSGDSISLDLENGGQTLIYWHGNNYRGLLLQGGD